ncbi:MAG: ketoacyl-ACP synthase III [Oscillospiraceae bacterium]|jgi:3-oxoacyl-[acyl-carrier-protein] synthase-3|nr:ketoacyl-ACP synthase III [Oscillospiraceae bacterium]
MNIAILGTGRYLPEFVLRNKDFEAFTDTSDEWIVSRTGMKERRVSGGEPAWRMGELAARNALEAAGVSPGGLDLIICSSVTGDFRYPSVACMIQGALGAENAFAFDIAAACTGSVYAMDVARLYLAAGAVKAVLVVGTEWLTQQVDYADRSSCVLFGDGAGAAVLGRGNGAYGSALFSDPGGAKYLYDAIPRHDYPFLSLSPCEEAPFPISRAGAIVMDGREVYKFATKAMPRAVLAACEKAGVRLEDIDLLIPHQANLRILETAVKNLNFPPQRVYSNIEKYANTSSATILIGLDECVRAGRLKEGDLFCLVGFGSGLTWGALVAEYHR